MSFLLCSHFTQNSCQIIPLQDVSVKFLPTILVTGKPSKIMQETLMFKIDVGQWVNFSKEKALFLSVVPSPKMDGGRRTTILSPISITWSIYQWLGFSLESSPKMVTSSFLLRLIQCISLEPYLKPCLRVCRMSQFSSIPDFLYCCPHPDTPGEVEGSHKFWQHSKQEDQVIVYGHMTECPDS